ncbi:hypothetical protein BJ322DRAFT_1067364 [Thelephora terrestris]|uniref:GYF domain-containing protein n=1 Tax=Thelephora terrestris TaxID=56493 RepID=A0A9P6HCJ4_9AGAM|nr:hypothetical protein BJ322DRAFT_1067364 [Thelephora terrestris]
MAPRPSAKRPASETFASTSKKTRFLDPEEDPANFSEQIESNLEDDPRTRRKGRVRTEGYESDSSDDGEGVVNSRKPANDAEGDDDDMFASTVPEEKKPVENAKKEKDKFLRLGDIEGQEFGLGDGSDSSESDEPEDEDDAERRKKAGMGYELSSFNMREEMEEGKFSADGSYIRTFDPHAVHDRWLEDTDEKEMKKARRVLKQREKMEREKQEAEEKELQDMGGKLSIEVQLLAKLRKGETVLEALQRLGVKKNKGSKGRGKVAEKAPPDPVSDEINLVTHLASTLMSLGDTEIYSKTYEQVVRSVRSSGDVEPDWEPPSADVKYEYKWIGATDGQTFGPFGEEELTSWFKAAYFGSMGEKVKVRKVGGEWGDWDQVVS